MLVNNWYNEQSHFEMICLYQSETVVLGPQASPPARVERNQVPDDGCAGRGQAGAPAVPGRRFN